MTRLERDVELGAAHLSLQGIPAALTDSTPRASGTRGPPLDSAGNSVRGQAAARFLSRRLGLGLFVSEPAR